MFAMMQAGRNKLCYCVVHKVDQAELFSQRIQLDEIDEGT